MLPRHYESKVVLNTSVDVLLLTWTTSKKLSAHMQKSSGMMMGSKMTIEMDAGDGRVLGSKVRMYGKMMGMALSLEEVVTERKPPLQRPGKPSTRSCW